MPRRVAPLRAHEERFPRGDVVDEEALPVAGILRHEVVGRTVRAGGRHLEEHPLSVGREMGKEDRRRAAAELLREIITVAFLDIGDRHHRLDLAGAGVEQLEVAMRTRIPVAAVDRQPVVDGPAETELPVFGELPDLQRVEIDDLDTPLAILDVVESYASSIADPLLTGSAVGVLGVDAPRDHGLPARRALPDHEVSAVGVGRGRGEEEHAGAVGALGTGQIISVRDVASRLFGYLADRDLGAPRGERISGGGGQRGGGGEQHHHRGLPDHAAGGAGKGSRRATGPEKGNGIHGRRWG